MWFAAWLAWRVCLGGLKSQTEARYITALSALTRILLPFFPHRAACEWLSLFLCADQSSQHSPLSLCHLPKHCCTFITRAAFRQSEMCVCMCVCKESERERGYHILNDNPQKQGLRHQCKWIHVKLPDRVHF